MLNGPTSVKVLGDNGRGRWLVHTSASSYLVDLDRRTLRRMPGGLGDPDWLDTRQLLRRDGDDVALLAVVRCAVGQEAVFVLHIRTGDVITDRRTTPVMAIESAP